MTTQPTDEPTPAHQTITLDITYDPAQESPPSEWSWHELIDCSSDEVTINTAVDDLIARAVRDRVLLDPYDVAVALHGRDAIDTLDAFRRETREQAKRDRREQVRYVPMGGTS